jgi:hypothetical protein
MFHVQGRTMKPRPSSQAFGRIAVAPPRRDGRACARERTLFLVKAVWLFCFGLVAGQLRGATFFVTSTLDSGTLVPPGSLRQAMLDANGTFGDDTIQILAVGTIALVTNLPAITDNTTIIGPGMSLLTISASNQFGVFVTKNGTTNTLSNLTIANGAVSNHYPAVAYGGGISNAGSLKLLTCAIRNCTASHGLSAKGGGIYNAKDLFMKNCQVTDCHVVYLRAEDPDPGPGGGIYNAGVLGMEACLVSLCSAGVGGGISGGPMFLTNCVIEGCAALANAGDGGGLFGGGTIQSCTISDCFSALFGGGIDWGGGKIASSTIVDNSATYGAGLTLRGTNVMAGCTVNGNAGNAGVYNLDDLTMVNCTVSGNGGSGIKNGSLYPPATYSTIYASHCTIASNTAAYAYGVANAGSFHAQDSIFAGNGANDFSGELIAEGYNLIQNTDGCSITGNPTGSLYGADPLLGPLQDNGGPTWTHALLANSPCIDHGTAGGLTTDQRGAPRPLNVSTIPYAGDGSDIGAYEWTPPPTACDMAAQTIQNQPLTIAALKLLLCAANPMGYPLSLSSVSAHSTNGGTVVFAGDAVTYTPTAGFLGSDSFTYTITDSWGATAAGQVTVSVMAGNTPSSNMLPATYNSGGLLVRFSGIVGRTNSVQRAPAVTGPWVTIGTATIGPAGIGSLEDTNPPPGSAFYRTTFP